MRGNTLAVQRLRSLHWDLSGPSSNLCIGIWVARAQIKSLFTSKFFVLDFDENWWMCPVRCHEQSYYRNFWRKICSLKLFQFLNVSKFFLNIYNFFIYQWIFIMFYCSLAVVLLNSNPLEFKKNLYPFSRNVKNKFLENYS